MYLAYWTLFISLSLSLVAAWYSIIGLTAIFAAAVIPVIIMGAILEVAKVSVTVWLHRYWSQCRLLMKIYLVPAVLLLMLITSMGIFGYLSKAHLDQGVPSSDVAAQLALYDEKIKTERENIEAARKALQQMDASVDQTMSRSTTEQGASKAVQIRKSQAKERNSLQTDIANAQANIAKLNQERAPVASQLRRVEAEVGPIKYVAALIYGDSIDATALERAVRWIIIILVSVFDPLAIMLVLAATESMKWEKLKKLEKVEDIVDEDHGNCPKCDSKLFNAPGIGPYCPNDNCDVIDNILNWDAPKLDIHVRVPELDEEIVVPAEIKEPAVEETVIEEPAVEEIVTEPVKEYIDPKTASAIWKSMSGHSTLKEQRRLLEQGKIERLPWDEEEFLNLIRSGKLK
jgi:hypothetical protein